jgi:hypothetical protein
VNDKKLLKVSRLALMHAIVLLLTQSCNLSDPQDAATTAKDNTVGTFVSNSPTAAGSSLPQPTTAVVQCSALIVAPENMRDLMKEIEDVPLYPGASNISRRPYQKGGVEGEIEYQTSDSYQMVQTFYKEALGTKGWILDVEAGPYYHFLIFTWRDILQRVPWRFELIMDPTEASSGGTNVLIRLHPVPDLEAVPLMPGAEAVKFESSMPQEGDKISCRTTYTIRASPSEVYEYYRSNLLRYGWVEGKEPSREGQSSADPGRHFWYLVEYHVCQDVGRAYIVAEQSTNDTTEVKISTSGWPERLRQRCSDIPESTPTP